MDFFHRSTPSVVSSCTCLLILVLHYSCLALFDNSLFFLVYSCPVLFTNNSLYSFDFFHRLPQLIVSSWWWKCLTILVLQYSCPALFDSSLLFLVYSCPALFSNNSLYFSISSIDQQIYVDGIMQDKRYVGTFTCCLVKVPIVQLPKSFTSPRRPGITILFSCKTILSQFSSTKKKERYKEFYFLKL